VVKESEFRTVGQTVEGALEVVRIH
jgi:hypothetical protein